MTPGLNLVADLWSASAGYLQPFPDDLLIHPGLPESFFLFELGSDYLAQTIEASKPNGSPGGICICLTYYRQKCVREHISILEHLRIPKTACGILSPVG